VNRGHIEIVSCNRIFGKPGASGYIALAGFVRDGIHDRIRRALDDTFGGLARPKYIPPPDLTPRPQDIVAYAYLFKHLEFAVPFERLDEPITFGPRKLAGFGMSGLKPGCGDMCPQVLLLDYRTPDDFVIEPRTKSAGDRLILAKCAPGETLARTVDATLRRADPAKAAQATPGDVLRVPKLNFDVTRRYGELEGKRLVSGNPAVAKDLILLSALQNTRFQLDEKGVRLRSEGHMAFGCSRAAMPEPKHVMVFDRPFLITLVQTGAKAPYFALWVDNVELLVTASP
jgi:hypothetical protein